MFIATSMNTDHVWSMIIDIAMNTNHVWSMIIDLAMNIDRQWSLIHEHNYSWSMIVAMKCYWSYMISVDQWVISWSLSNITRFCVKHIKTLDKQEKFIFLKPILEIKTENLLVSLEGHQTSGARSPELWCPQQYVLDFHSRRSQGPVFRSIKWAHIDHISLQKNAGAPEF